MTNTDVFPIWPATNVATNSQTEPAPLSDHALAIAAGKGDLKAFETLYERHNRRVFSLCLRMTQNGAEAEDLAQEAFIQLFRKIGSFRGESAFTTWLHRLTVNQVLMHFRKRSVKLERTTDEGETPVQIVRGTENPNSMPVMDRIALDNALKQLPPGYRSVFLLHDVEGHEHEEIAKILLIRCSSGLTYQAFAFHDLLKGKENLVRIYGLDEVVRDLRSYCLFHDILRLILGDHNHR